MKRVARFQVIDHGIDHSQHFQGCGTSHTEYTDVATGIGDSRQDALSDALESLAQNGWDVEGIENFYTHDASAIVEIDRNEYGEDNWYHVSVRVRDGGA